MVYIEQIRTMDGKIGELTELLIDVVEGGASIGFLPPLTSLEAEGYWENVLNPDVILFIAKVDHKIVGTLQVHLCRKPNGKHRAEIAKLMTHSNYRQMGIGRLLMKTAEEAARREARSLLVLDTREGDPSNHLYTTLGFVEAGRIPNYAMSANGTLDATILYYKSLL